VLLEGLMLLPSPELDRLVASRPAVQARSTEMAAKNRGLRNNGTKTSAKTVAGAA
jgi:hypothetical protein